MPVKPESHGRERQLFKTLMREHHRRVLAYAQSLLFDPQAAEDLVQESFLTAYLQLDQFDATRDFGAWVRGIVRIKYMGLLRRRREVPVDESTLEAIEEEHLRWDRARENDGLDVFAILRSCLQQLPEILQNAVRCFYFDRMSCDAIAKHLEASVPTIRQRLHRGREVLHACVEQQMASDQ